MKRRTLFIFLIPFILLLSCQSTSDRFDVDVSEIEIEPVKIHRYGKALFEIDKTNLQKELKRIQPQYAVFLNGDLDDTLNLIQLSDYINDTLLISVSEDCFVAYPNLNDVENELSTSFKYLKYYHPEKSIPQVYTYISGFDYEYQVQYFEDNLMIALDMYLGEEYHRYYNLGLPKYILKKFSEEYIVRDCFSEIAKSEIDYRKIGNGLLDMMINEGKILWFTQAMIPGIEKAILINYTESHMQWAFNNEGSIWAFLIENQKLYSKDMDDMQKFIYDGPFTSYFGEDSPPRLGWFIGWRIVSAFMENNKNVDLSVLMNEYDAQNILQESGYKPEI